MTLCDVTYSPRVAGMQMPFLHVSVPDVEVSSPLDVEVTTDTTPVYFISDSP